MTIEQVSSPAMALDDGEVQAFPARLRGQLLRPGEADYDAARTVFNAMIDRKPALIVRCAGVADVIDAVTFARTHDLLVAVRGGGHHVAGNAVCVWRRRCAWPCGGCAASALSCRGHSPCRLLTPPTFAGINGAQPSG